MANDDRSARQIARSKQRRAGDASARLATALMALGDAALARLVIDDELREAIDRARAVTTNIARRRAERTLAGDLRRFDLAELEAALNAASSNDVDVKVFHLAERWRARLVEEGAAALAEFPGGADDELAGLVNAAQRERTTGRPRGAARALFRGVAARLKQPTPPDDH